MWSNPNDDPDSHVWANFKVGNANNYQSFKVRHSINGKFQLFSRHKGQRSVLQMRSKSPAAMSMLDANPSANKQSVFNEKHEIKYA